MSKIMNGGRDPVCPRDREILSLATLEYGERPRLRGQKQVQLPSALGQ